MFCFLTNSPAATAPRVASEPANYWRAWGCRIAPILSPLGFSGGEQRRVVWGRPFVVRPPILLADEPTGNLDSQNGQHVLELLISLNQREGTTLVLVTHDAALSSRASRRITLRDGRIVSDERAS